MSATNGAPQRVTVKAKRLGDEWRIRAYVDGHRIAEAVATSGELLGLLARVQGPQRASRRLRVLDGGKAKRPA